MSDHADDDTKKEALSTHFLDSDDDDEKQMRGNGRKENDDDAFLAKYDSDGYGDEADRAQLMQMNELDREEELAKRSAKLKILKDRKRILEKAKEREEKELCATSEGRKKLILMGASILFPFLTSTPRCSNFRKNCTKTLEKPHWDALGQGTKPY